MKEGESTGSGLTIARNSMWLMLDSLAAIVSSFYCSISVARVLGPDAMGQYNYVLYFATVLRMFAEVAIPATIRKFAAEFAGRGDFSTVRTLVRHLLGFQAKLASAAVVVGLSIVFLEFSAELRVVGALAVVSILPSMLLSTPSGAIQATESLKEVVLSSLVSVATNVA